MFSVHHIVHIISQLIDDVVTKSYFLQKYASYHFRQKVCSAVIPLPSSTWLIVLVGLLQLRPRKRYPVR